MPAIMRRFQRSIYIEIELFHVAYIKNQARKLTKRSQYFKTRANREIILAFTVL